jgi:hypothetical protein
LVQDQSNRGPANDAPGGRRTAKTRNAAQMAVGALVLLLGMALGWRFRQGPPELPVTAREAAKPPAPPASPGLSPLDLRSASSGSLALGWMALLESAPEKSAKTVAEEERVRSQEHEFALETKKRLSQDPSRWTDVLEVLSQEDPRIGRKIIDALKDGVEDAAEPTLLRSLKEGRHREVRLASVTLLGTRMSPESLWALVNAAQEDSDSGVRYQALTQLAIRKDRSGSPSETSTIDQVLLLRARVDPDLAVRRFALGVTGEVPGNASPSSLHAEQGALLRR